MRWLILLFCFSCHAQVGIQYRSDVIREAHYQFGLSAPVALFAAQAYHESGFRPTVVAWDGGEGLMQTQPSTSKWLSQINPELGTPEPLSPVWSIRAGLYLNRYNYDRIDASDECNRWAKTLFAYNAGRGYLIQKEKASPYPLVWYGFTESYPTSQSAINAKESEQYPRIITYQIQERYLTWGGPKTC